MIDNGTELGFQTRRRIYHGDGSNCRVDNDGNPVPINARRCVLVKWRGALCLAEITPTRRENGESLPGRCPDCGGTVFQTDPHDWIECITDGCGFAVCRSGLIAAFVAWGLPIPWYLDDQAE